MKISARGAPASAFFLVVLILFLAHAGPGGGGFVSPAFEAPPFSKAGEGRRDLWFHSAVHRGRRFRVRGIAGGCRACGRLCGSVVRTGLDGDADQDADRSNGSHT